jgi:hypothetical protein
MVGKNRHVNRCSICAILLDMPCPNEACEGHQNARVGQLCLYCATNGRENLAFLRAPFSPLCSSLKDIGYEDA